MKLHIVQPGDTLWSVARRYDIPIQTLLQANDELGDPDRLEPGTKVRIPTGKVPVSLHKTEETVDPQEPLPSLSKESSSSKEIPLERPSLGREGGGAPAYPSPQVPPMPEAPKYQPQEPKPFIPPGMMPSPYSGMIPGMPPISYPNTGYPSSGGCGCGGQKRPPRPVYPYYPQPMMPGPGYQPYPMPAQPYPYPMPGRGYPIPGPFDPMPGMSYPAPGSPGPSPSMTEPTKLSEQVTPANAPPEDAQSMPPYPLPLESSEENGGQVHNYAELFRGEEERESSSAEL